MGTWGFLTNHALVLIHIANHPRSTQREIAAAAGITERAAHTILRMLEAEEIVSRQKEGRRNRYVVDFDALMGHQLDAPYSVAELVENLMVLSRRLQQVAS
jgi:DNA-binding IclR family transcriptional regulator